MKGRIIQQMIYFLNWLYEKENKTPLIPMFWVQHFHITIRYKILLENTDTDISDIYREGQTKHKKRKR